MKIIVHTNGERGKGEYGWLSTRYSFSFSNWYNKNKMGFGALRVLNDDVIDAYHHFADPEWDGEPISPVDDEPAEPKPPKGVEGEPPLPPEPPTEPNKKLKIKLRDGKEREIQHMIATSFWGADGKPISVEEFLQNLFGTLPSLFKSEEELREIWSNSITRKSLLEKLDDAGYGKDELTTLQKLIDAENSDLFDVLEYVFNSDIKPIPREVRVETSQENIFESLNDKQKEFIEFVLSKYIETGVEELDQEKLPILLTNKYQSLEDAKDVLGDIDLIRSIFFKFQEHLYAKTK